MLSPIDPATAQARRTMSATPENIALLREKMGLNHPLPVQYFNWLKQAFRLDFGQSYVNDRSVFAEVTKAFSFTLITVLIAMVIEGAGSLLLASPSIGSAES